MKTNLFVNSPSMGSLAPGQPALNHLQEDTRQVLAAAMLWIEFSKKENGLQEDTALLQARQLIKIAIEKISQG